MASVTTGISRQGFATILLDNDVIRVVVMPELGGKIYSIEDLRSGRDWLWKNPDIALRRPNKGLDYGSQLDSGGWDDILFSVSPCTVELESGELIAIPDHGPLVGLPARVTLAGPSDDGAVSCETLVEDDEPEFRLARRVRLDASRPRMEVEYRLENTGSVAWPWIWCAHPLLAVEEGMRLSFEHDTPGDPGPLKMVFPDAAGERQFWPFAEFAPGQRIDLSSIFVDRAMPERFCAKVFVQSSGSVCVSTVDGGENLRLTFDRCSLPWTGLWINKRGWSGADTLPYLNLGLEPATTPADSLNQAVAAGQAPVMQPGASCEWRLLIELGSGGCRHD